MSDEQTQEGKKRSSSAALFIKWALLILIGLPVVWFAFCEARKGYWDWRVTQMCERDGGVSVNRKIALSNSQLDALKNKFGEFVIPFRGDANSTHRLIRDDVITYIRRNDPEIRRDEVRIIDTDSQETIAVRVTYSRVGGDAIALHSSYFSCPTPVPDIFSAAIEEGVKQ